MLRVAARWVLGAMVAAHVIEAIELRRRRRALPTLPPVSGAAPAPSPATDAKVDVMAAGATLDGSTLAVVAAEAGAPDGKVDLMVAAGATVDGPTHAAVAAQAGAPDGKVDFMLAAGATVDGATLAAVAAEVGAPDGKVDVMVAAGATVDGGTLAAVAAEMEASDAQVVDLVPGDLPADRMLRLLRRVQPGQLGTDPFYTPGGANEAVAIHHSVASRMTEPVAVPSDALDRGHLVRWTVEAQRHAPTASTLRLAPAVRAAPSTPAARWRELEEVWASALPYGSLAPILLSLETAHLALMTAGLFVAPGFALAALATWNAQPAVVGLGGRASVGRLPRAWADNLRTVVAGARATRARAVVRARTPVPVPPDVDRLFEPVLTTCAWCESPDLVGRLDVSDLLQHKPGSFHLDECRACGHIFQNPALTQAGLDYYYEDAYDGVGKELAEASFAALGPIYRNRVASLARATTPRTWLDVGTGHGHFCLAARERWPDLEIDGLDMSDSVDEAQRRGRIDTAYRGFFPDLADGLPRSYDVVSMHHYLEHTRDPRPELRAAAKVVAPGGYLMIEGPDPASPWSRRLGRFWWQWGQPQHQHFVTCEAMVAVVEECGFDVVSVERGPATMSGELFNAVGLVLQSLARSPHLPWLPPVSVGHRAKRLALFTAAIPAMALTKSADVFKDSVLLRLPGTKTPGNAYRLVAHRP
jgi:SAM-dependent methyltransferase